MKVNEFFVFGCIYIAMWTGITIGDDTLSARAAPEQIAWWMPIGIFVAFAFPFIMGYLAGKDD